MSSDLAVRSTVRDLVAAFQQAEAVVRLSFCAIVEAEKRLNAAFTLGGDHPIRIEASRHSHSEDYSDADEAVARMARGAWEVIVDRLELRRMLSIKRYAEIEEQLRKGELPPITEANVMAFAEQYITTLPELLAEAVTEVFDWLRPPASRYKTNTELELGRRVVLSWMVERNFHNSGYRVVYSQQQKLTALENVFNALDGKGQISKTHFSALQMAIESPANADGRGETPLFRYRAFRNHNLHLEFTRPDLLARLNAMAGGKRLRPTEQGVSL